jgi:hypothetical protein
MIFVQLILGHLLEQPFSFLFWDKTIKREMRDNSHDIIAAAMRACRQRYKIHD